MFLPTFIVIGAGVSDGVWRTMQADEWRFPKRLSEIRRGEYHHLGGENNGDNFSLPSEQFWVNSLALSRPAGDLNQRIRCPAFTLTAVARVAATRREPTVDQDQATKQRQA
jgi:hypothetical protein